MNINKPHDKQDQSSHKDKLVEIEIDLPDDLYAAVEKLSKQLKITKEEFIIKAMKEFLSKGE